MNTPLTRDNLERALLGETIASVDAPAGVVILTTGDTVQLWSGKCADVTLSTPAYTYAPVDAVVEEYGGVITVWAGDVQVLTVITDTVCSCDHDQPYGHLLVTPLEF